MVYTDTKKRYWLDKVQRQERLDKAWSISAKVMSTIGYCAVSAVFSVALTMVAEGWLS